MPTHASKGPDFLSVKIGNEIRRAWNAGKKQITLEGRKFNLSKLSKRNSFMVNGVAKSQMEYWIIVKPANGALVPMASIELKPQGNMRTVTAK